MKGSVPSFCCFILVLSCLCPLLVVWLGTCHVTLLIFNFSFWEETVLWSLTCLILYLCLPARFCQISVKSDFLERRALSRIWELKPTCKGPDCPPWSHWRPLAGRVWGPDSWQLAILRVAPTRDLAPDGASQGYSRRADPSWVALGQTVSQPPGKVRGWPFSTLPEHSGWTFFKWRCPCAVLCVVLGPLPGLHPGSAPFAFTAVVP